MEENEDKKQRIVPDTSVIISGILTDLVKKGEIKEAEISLLAFSKAVLNIQGSGLSKGSAMNKFSWEIPRSSSFFSL